MFECLFIRRVRIIHFPHFQTFILLFDLHLWKLAYFIVWCQSLENHNCESAYILVHQKLTFLILMHDDSEQDWYKIIKLYQHSSHWKLECRGLASQKKSKGRRPGVGTILPPFIPPPKKKTQLSIMPEIISIEEWVFKLSPYWGWGCWISPHYFRMSISP